MRAEGYEKWALTDPWALTELAKAGGQGGFGGYPPSGYFCLSVPWFVTGPLRAVTHARLRIQFIYAIYQNVRHVMYKSGKRSAEYLEKKLSDIDVPVSSLPHVSIPLTQPTFKISHTSVPQQVIVNTQPTSEILYTSQVIVNTQPNYARSPTSLLPSTLTLKHQLAVL